MANTNYAIRITGNTKPHRDALKAAGYRWEPRAQYWHRTVEAPIPEYRSDNKSERMAVIGGVCWPDVQILVAPVGKLFRVYFTGANCPAASAAATATPDYSDPMNRGANGQFVHGVTRISGSAPDDFE